MHKQSIAQAQADRPHPQVTANKIAIIKDVRDLQDFCAPGGVPAYYT